MSIQQLASRLQLRVVRCGKFVGELSDGQNSVIIIAAPHKRVLVNGRPLETNEPITATGSTIMVSTSLEKRIKQNLRPRNYKPTNTQNPVPAKPQNTPNGPIVVLDAGHGGKDTGAISAAGYREKDIVLNVTRLVAKQLRDSNVRVVMTRNKDVYVGLDRRVYIANTSKCVLFVSIHADAAANKTVRGFTVYVPRREKNNSPSHRVGKNVEQQLKGFTKNRGVRKHSKNLRVLENTNCPAMLIEMGYLSNRYEAARLSTYQTQQKIANSIATAILSYLK